MCYPSCAEKDQRAFEIHIVETVLEQLCGHDRGHARAA